MSAISLEKITRFALPIDSAILWHVDLPMKKPFRISTGEVKSKPFLVVELISDGVSGFGEAAVLPEPFYNSEDPQIAHHVLDLLLKKLSNRSGAGRLLSHSDLASLMNSFKGNFIAKSALDFAFFYLYAKLNELPLTKIAGSKKESIPVQESIGIGTEKEVSSYVESAYSRGIRSIKLKIMPGHSYKIAKFVRDSFSPKFISVDANASFNPRDPSHLSEIMKTSEFADEIEQPFFPKNLLSHAKLARDVSSIVSLDESIETLDDAFDIAELSDSKIAINIKPPRIGGFYNSILLVNEMKKLGVELFVGGLLETSLGRQFNLSIASMDAVCNKLTADCSPASDFYTMDLTKKSFDITNGRIFVDYKSPVPYEVDVSILKKYGKKLGSYSFVSQ
ncbi:o-succinylbenzoate synthase [Candidatus Micrarchaeota archaeon]|nr:o-succinylbenzoate synthase [Candidatus Micrarchaeota archaeon]